MEAKGEKLLVKEKEYRFGGPDGQASLEDLFGGRRQLIVYRDRTHDDVVEPIDEHDRPAGRGTGAVI